MTHAAAGAAAPPAALATGCAGSVAWGARDARGRPGRPAAGGRVHGRRGAWRCGSSGAESGAPGRRRRRPSRRSSARVGAAGVCAVAERARCRPRRPLKRPPGRRGRRVAARSGPPCWRRRPFSLAIWWALLCQRRRLSRPSLAGAAVLDGARRAPPARSAAGRLRRSRRLDRADRSRAASGAARPRARGQSAYATSGGFGGAGLPLPRGEPGAWQPWTGFWPGGWARSPWARSPRGGGLGAAGGSCQSSGAVGLRDT